MAKFNLANQEFELNLKENRIESIVIFGSYVSGGFDRKSDIDFFIVIHNCSYDVLKKIKQNIANQLKVPEDWITIFTKDELYNRAMNGEYFIWTIKIQGKIIYSKTGYLEDVFKHLSICHLSEVKKMLNYYYELLDQHVLPDTTNKVLLEKRIYYIARLIRSVCIDIDYLNGIIEFDKVNCVQAYLNTYSQTPFTIEEYKELLEHKRNISTGLELNFNGDLQRYVKSWRKKLRILLEIEEIEINYYARRGFISPLTKYKKK